MGKLTLIGLPIGNLGDLTPRALEKLQEAQIIFAEDTRSFKEFLKRISVNYSSKEIYSFHDQSDDNRSGKIATDYKGRDIVCVSEAGSAYISDPAYPLVQAALKEGFQIETCPGVSAVQCALELSGLPPIPYTFLGFFPRETSKQKEYIAKIISGKSTYIIFEGVSRVIATLELLTEALPDCDFSVARELTKSYESVHRFHASEFAKIKNDIILKGEFTICLYQPKEGQQKNSSLESVAQAILDEGAKPKKISELLSLILDIPKKDIYNKLNRS